jgi:hypothetical protein
VAAVGLQKGAARTMLRSMSSNDGIEQRWCAESGQSRPLTTAESLQGS